MTTDALSGYVMILSGGSRRGLPFTFFQFVGHRGTDAVFAPPRFLTRNPYQFQDAQLRTIVSKLNRVFLVSRSPNRFRPTDALSVAEAVFKPAPQPPAEPVIAEKRAGIPVSKEQVSLKLDSDIIAHFQEDGPGWQERINDALRRAAGL
jgi:uncharacterized protein (DUF4415 family)